MYMYIYIYIYIYLYMYTYIDMHTHTGIYCADPLAGGAACTIEFLVFRV